MDRIVNLGLGYLFIRSLEHTIITMRDIKVLMFIAYFMIVHIVGSSLVSSNHMANEIASSGMYQISILNSNLIVGNMFIVLLLIGLIAGIVIMSLKFIDILYRNKENP